MDYSGKIWSSCTPIKQSFDLVKGSSRLSSFLTRLISIVSKPIEIAAVVVVFVQKRKFQKMFVKGKFGSNIACNIAFNFRFNIELNIWFTIGPNIRFNVGVQYSVRFVFDIWVQYWDQHWGSILS